MSLETELTEELRDLKEYSKTHSGYHKGSSSAAGNVQAGGGVRN